jgi:NAD(P)-dependent dehydrogenase (short-subunit alcohol dehydrogenase family)
VANISSLLGSVSSGAGLGHWDDYAYGPSKAALNRAIRQLAIDYKGEGITVIAQNPGWVKTDMGGIEAPLNPAEAVATMRELFHRITIEDSGRVIEPNGNNAPW